MLPCPGSDQEFESTFSTEQDCLEYIISVRWPDGPRCPRCQHDKLWRNEQGLVLQCSACGQKTRPLVGTIFQDTHLSLRCWFRMMWHIMSQKYGANATGLARVLKLSHSTTWNILHKLRRAMVRIDREKLGPTVEVDEFFVGGLEAGKPGRGSKKKALIVLAVEMSDDKKRLGRVRFEVIPDAKSATLIPFIERCVEPGSTIITDGWAAYSSLKNNGYTHKIESVRLGTDALPNAHRVISLLKRWMLGTFQGSISPKYLAYYLDEFAFRFNRRKSSSRGKLFQRLAEQAVASPPVKRKELRFKELSAKPPSSPVEEEVS